MGKLLLSVHVIAAILAVGSIAVAASLFPRFAKLAAAETPPEGGEEKGRAVGIAAFLHRICRIYAVAGLVVPVFGLATGAHLGVLGDAWLITSMILTAVAAFMLAMAIIPGQERMLTMARTGGAAVEGVGAAAARLGMLTGIFNLLWTVVVVLMIVRPGSTTGV
ncbi:MULTISPECIES: hypothetical protein [Streptomyces]|uniref:Uncharacterized protein n=2 Tax=Streptomyces TaxID=1883 RepID=A0A1D8G1X4_9ACTN|nr:MULTISPECIES: hypothetical protein [Streptomyces]AOT59458.1 hypothetical protein A4G23_02300 [Streptomyces rubrolavendulae]KAF0647899.1 membrane protein [Streptomyces fradiae ATCC 10745 = DSM 40063]OSY48771.1 hypothetical protein BG846_05646 [Streptomyces fradiae ATCC 10745 = DSM 40063]QEV12716.1 hypothetical protein CP974_12650 [Streptomyces fradiae ATCC 10745 = DSM 40063]UQS32028.1 hypothetical protein J5J01_10890 [Streptomyces fradiae]